MREAFSLSSSSSPPISQADASRDWLTPDILDKFETHLETIPPKHLAIPVDDEIFSTLAAARERVKDWAFTQGHCIVVGRKSLRLECKHHGTQTKNTRKLQENERKRKYTPQVDQKGCGFDIRVYRSGGEWTLKVCTLSHNHPPASNPFSYAAHKYREPGREEIEQRLAELRRAGVPFSKARAVEGGGGGEVSRRQYYNLSRTPAGTREEERLTSEEDMIDAEDRRIDFLRAELEAAIAARDERRRNEHNKRLQTEQGKHVPGCLCRCE